ncbi:tyrosinase family protein [Paractinoplanes toevensis]|uniref:Tyrosinase copper-binding domain-containing protein n=1 Tax=Paractinoplanes toevensis TaxID=571911 RepID=A0A919W838_9ACTN|nr:tyrosinase family protein [Actinoplanes toevensis]GIM91836.1 hypothetical protein Ato02nite_036290 [Actinoplanes toevensis]
MPTFVRHDIVKLEQQQAGHPVTRAYAVAIAAMKALPRDDPRSLVYQCAVHGGAVEDRFLNQCQHFTWYFLPWHRMYLYWFEQIARKFIQDSAAVDDETKATWALPYWNYTDNRPAGTVLQPGALPFRDVLPEPFRIPGNSGNALFVPGRNVSLSRGGRIDPRSTSTQRALSETDFSRPPMPGIPPGFGGPSVGLHHDFSGSQGALESSPHGGVHVAVGGLMGRQNQAALDPIFWLHHANIDRLWETWRTQFKGENPTGADWLDTDTFFFHDADGNEVHQTVREVVETLDLNYEYEDVSAPAGPLEAITVQSSPGHPPELVGATGDATRLTGDITSTRFPLSPPAGPLRAAAAEPSHVYLNVEDIRAAGVPDLSYAVYLNVPDTDLDPENDAHYVGNITFFGIELSQDLDHDHPGGHSEFREAFDITDLYTRLRADGRWNEDEVTVTFVPLGVLPPPEAGPADPPPAASTPITLGRVSLFYQ